MRFAEPYWLWIGAAVVALVFVPRLRAERLTAQAIRSLSGARLIDAATLPSAFRRWLRVGVVTLAAAAAFIALARPQQGKEWQTLDRKGTDLLLVIDTSKSMNADDVSPTRLERTKLAVRDLVGRFPEDRVGLMAFAGDAYLESPLTLDHGALLETLDDFDSSLIAKPGTDLGRAIDSATAALKSDASSQKLMVLLTDGEDLQGQGLDAAKRAAQAGITIETVGVGTPAGELVPAKDEGGATIGVLRDPDGNAVRSRLDESGLRAIAQAAHGTYRALGADGAGLERLYAESLTPLAQLQHGAQVRRVYREWFAVPLGLSLLGIVLDALLGFRPRARSAKRLRREKGSRAGRPAVAAALALGLLMLLSASAQASPQSAENAYRAGHFDEAARQYDVERTRHPADARLAIDAGAAAYRAGHFEAAEASLQKALHVADPKLQERVLYDLGDARYRLGAATVKDAPQKTIERWKSAIAAYEGALKLSPGDADARFNRDFVKRKLSELEKQQKPPQDKPPQPASKDQQQQKGQGSKDSKRQDSKGQDSKGQDAKDSKGQDAKDKSPKNQDGKSPSGAHEPAKQDQPGQNGEPPGPGKQPGTPPPSQTGSTPGEAGKAARPGELSPADARTLLDSLRGEERQVKFGKSVQPSDDEPPQKDW